MSSYDEGKVFKSEQVIAVHHPAVKKVIDGPVSAFRLGLYPTVFLVLLSLHDNNI